MSEMTDQGEAAKLADELESAMKNSSHTWLDVNRLYQRATTILRAMAQAERGDVPCCGRWDECRKPCTPRGHREGYAEALRAKPASPGEGGAEPNVQIMARDSYSGVERPVWVTAETARQLRADVARYATPFAAPPQAEKAKDLRVLSEYIAELEKDPANKAALDAGRERGKTAAAHVKAVLSEQPADARMERSIAYDVWQRCNGQEQPLEMCRISVREGHAAGFAEAAATVQKMLDDLAGVDDYAAPHYRFILRIAVKKLQPKAGGR